MQSDETLLSLGVTDTIQDYSDLEKLLEIIEC